MRVLPIAASAVFVLLGAEVGLRAAGLIDFPLYHADARTGYIPRANQEGSFLLRRDFAINDRHMGTAEPFDAVSGRGDVLVVGDSIVWGGNPYLAEERLGPQLNLAYEGNVWPISAGSWSIVNEVNYLEDNADVVKEVDRIVFVVNTGDFGTPSSWRNPFTHPRERPASALHYALMKYAVKPDIPPTPADLIVPPEDPMEKLGRFVASCACLVDVWVYPNRAEVAGDAVELDTEEMTRRLTEEAGLEEDRVFSVSELVEDWGLADYKDTIHPTPAGMEKLAEALSTSWTDLVATNADL